MELNPTLPFNGGPLFRPDLFNLSNYNSSLDASSANGASGVLSSNSSVGDSGINSTAAPSNCTDGCGENRYILPWWQQSIFITMFVLMFIIAAGGNIIVIWIVLAHKRMRTVTNYFLVNLAIADVMISIFNVLFHFTFNLYQDWFFGLEYCKFAFFIASCTISVSVLTFMAIAIDRYIAIIHPLRPRLTGRIVLTIITIIWLMSILLALPNLLYATMYRYDNGRHVCYLHWPDSVAGEASQQDLAYNILLMVVNYFVPMITLAATYLRIGWELWGSQAIGEAVPMQAERIRSKRKVVKMMIAVVVIFGVCWLPTHLYFILSSIHKDIAFLPYVQQLYLLIYWLAMSNSMYNPIVYCLMNARFRAGFRRFFGFCFKCGSCTHDMILLKTEDPAMTSKYVN
ncbi:tachykinin-like peptides receptor 99D isoform X2 [Aplysia californica]|uniref:Tachykinin-like peptides receptor 99D isoform X2 n=1 Tax=Aplysia californica TaxID=6500 RepID=A0AAU7SSZ1_APLCA|nr:tachykinin-like peptides receptor 99D isoform X2 [Aplysia californica]